MRIKRFLSFFILSFTVLSFFSICYAASNNSVDFFNTGLPWDNLLSTIGKGVTGDIAKGFAILATVLAGVMLAFGETGGIFKKSMEIVFGLGIALNIAAWVGFLIGNTTISSDATVPVVVSMTDANFMSSFMTSLIAACKKGALILQGYSLKILGALAIIEIALAVSFKYDQDHIKYLFMETLKIGFYVFCIQQWVGGGMMGIANLIFTSFEVLGLKAAGVTMAQPDQIVSNGLLIVNGIWTATMKLSWQSIGLIFANILIIAAVVIAVFFTAIQIFITKVEFWIISTLSVALLPFGMYKQTRFLFEKATGALFSLGIKVMVMSFIAAISAPILALSAEGMKDPNVSAINATLPILLGCLVIYMLVQKAPDLAQGLLSGTPSLSGSDGMSAVKGAMSMPGGAASKMMGAAAGAMTIAGHLQTAMGMPGGRNSSGGANISGVAKNLASIGMSKMTSPFHDAMHSNLYTMQKQNDNKAAMESAKNGDGGAAFKSRMSSTPNRKEDNEPKN